jgi:hypothetical protein
MSSYQDLVFSKKHHKQLNHMKMTTRMSNIVFLPSLCQESDGTVMVSCKVPGKKRTSLEKYSFALCMQWPLFPAMLRHSGWSDGDRSRIPRTATRRTCTRNGEAEEQSRKLEKRPRRKIDGNFESWDLVSS